MESIKNGNAQLYVSTAAEFAVPKCEHYGKAKMAFLDPPFNIGQKYNGFTDKQESSQFENMIIDSIIGAVNWLDKSGSVICLHGPDALVEIYLDVMRFLSDSLGARRIAWVNWHYNFGECQTVKWTDARCHCLVYGFGNSAWNPEAVLIPSVRLLSGDKRVNQSELKGWRVPGTVWGIELDGKNWGRVQGNNPERWRDSPNQLPLKYLARLIKAYTNKGDCVVDPFCGSGTTALAAITLGRIAYTCDISKETIVSAAKRLTMQAKYAEELLSMPDGLPVH